MSFLLTASPSSAPLPRAPQESIVYSIPHEKYFYYAAGRWQLSSPITSRHAVLQYLMSRDLTQIQARLVLGGDTIQRVHGVDIIPARHGESISDLVQLPSGERILNVWTPPSLQPASGAYPTIERVLLWLTQEDAAGVHWLKNWMAAKVQDPARVPKTAVVFSGAPGSGKDTFAKIMMAMLGPENCAKISRRNLENRFNARWINKLFVFANEVVTKEHYVDIAENLKEYITSDYTEIEGKGENQRTQRNRLAWAFASNDPVSPVLVERGDRRYSVFTNHRPVPADYAAAVKALYTPSDEPTAAFSSELSAFYQDMLRWEVDNRAAATVYENESRRDLMEASANGHEMFLEAVDTEGIDSFLGYEVERAMGDRPREEWDFGAEGVSKTAVYQAYVQYCRLHGAKSSKINRFGIAVRHHHPTWGLTAVRRTKDGRRVNCYVLPRGTPDRGPETP
jgi:hypothetical protein